MSITPAFFRLNSSPSTIPLSARIGARCDLLLWIHSISLRKRHARSIVSAEYSDASCSLETWIGIQPNSTSCSSFRLSRSALAASFVSHQSLLCFGATLWIAQLCQKQPSTKTAIFTPVKTMSGVPEVCDTEHETVDLWECRVFRIAISALVETPWHLPHLFRLCDTDRRRSLGAIRCSELSHLTHIVLLYDDDSAGSRYLRK